MAAHWSVSFVAYFLFLLAMSHSLSQEEMDSYKDKVRGMFHHGYDNYMRHAFPKDELCPLTCSGRDTWGSYSLTLIDSLDTLLVMGNQSEFQKAYHYVASHMTFNADVNVSVFETNIRVIGGLLSAHLLSVRGGVPLAPGWPCEGPLLRQAEQLARKILPAFATPTGLPYGTVNLRWGVHPEETPVTCTACSTSFLLEFGALSRLTGDPVFEKTALRAIESIWQRRSSSGLFGNHINVLTGMWTATEFTIGNYVDSFLEYLVKGAGLLGHAHLWKHFMDLLPAIRQTNYNHWYIWVHMDKLTASSPLFVALDGYWPGLLVQAGMVEEAREALFNYFSVWRKYGSIPEMFNIVESSPYKQYVAYHLRPELAESLWYLYSATADPIFLEFARTMVDTIDTIARVPCGFATVSNVTDHRLTDRMESYFLAETLKYLYLLFDRDNFVSMTPSLSPSPSPGSAGGSRYTTHDRLLARSGCSVGASGYVMNTEAHPIDVGALHCCATHHHHHHHHQQQQQQQQQEGKEEEGSREGQSSAEDTSGGGKEGGEGELNSGDEQESSSTRGRKEGSLGEESEDSAKDLRKRATMTKEESGRKHARTQTSGGGGQLGCKARPFHDRFQVLGVKI